MTPRRPARLRRRDAFYRAIQRARLEQIADGTLEPRFAREFYFLWTLRAQGRADYADFILPSLLFLAEYELDKKEREEKAGATAEPLALPAP
ncbi:MAG: hypothetical protein KL785_08830 [Brevundimonas sp.]|nr:hypothetical protein [Brevundimonas sp.]